MKPLQDPSYSDPNDIPIDCLADTVIGSSTVARMAPGTRISENIELVRLLGAGGMGSVWVADHAGLSTRVAVKFMSKQLASDPDLVARFSCEAKLSARIKSPHMVQIFDFATTADGIPYIVMELLEGEDLETRLQSWELSLEDASRIIVQVCKALAKAHAVGIVHRDIKPDNVFLVENDGEIFVKILDLGIAKDQSTMARISITGTTMGTPSYMSPEQLFDPRQVDFRADLWSTAVLAYRCLTGQLPFPGSSFGSVCMAINAGKFPAPTERNVKLPAGLDAWFRRALSLRPDDRFGSALEMADAYLAELDRAGLLPNWAALRVSNGELKSFTTDAGGISGGPITLRSPSRRAARRWGGAVVAAGLVAAGVLGSQPSVRDWSAGWMHAQAVRVAPLSSPFVRWPTLAQTDEPPSRHEDELIRWMAPPSPVLMARPDPQRDDYGLATQQLNKSILESPESVELTPSETSPHPTPSTLVLGI